MHLSLSLLKRSLVRNIGIIAILSLILSACGGGGSSSNNTGSSSNPSCTPGSNTKLVKISKAHKIAWSQNALDGAWRFAEEASIEQQAQQHGYQLLKANANNSDVQQVQDIETLINDRPDVLLVDPHTEDAEAKAILDARKACIPVIVVDRDVNESLATPGRDFATFIGSDFNKQGQLAADALIESLGGPSTKATIVELSGTTGSSPAILRGGGFDGELASKAPGIKIVAEQTANFARATGQQVMSTLIQQYPNIKGVFAHNDEMAIGAITALKASGKHPGSDIKVVSIDGTKDAVNLVLSGEEYAVVQSNPRLGPLVFQTLDQYLKGQDLPAWVVQQDKVFKKADGSAAAYLPDAF
ncbi:ABC transporter substrate-binding protein [Dictyobacter arantiisoli]|uniref:Sugar ABC transporter substrate-binding protein n=1 Tax=Dictyobacter arantiisoli TaxID=2014874 RepID=A0A5A5TED8_9CHLR|nr:ABC transporter substrate-binding protein [Dictyobacter arantiisoli]GCF09920.1 sugar ABC transporter substrate-binding protein [Dictyobacter arantiisoli]